MTTEDLDAIEARITRSPSARQDGRVLTNEPYVRIWREGGIEVALLAAEDYRRIMRERAALWEEVAELQAKIKTDVQKVNWWDRFMAAEPR